MTKINIIRLLQKLSPYCIYCLDIVYHKMVYDGSYYYRYQYSANYPVFCKTPLVEVLLSLYKQRGNIRSIHLVYFDNQGQKQQIDYMVRDFVPCDNLSDFINSKNKQL
nr:MAG TPA: hypothetical protein [Microviridae sp.]